MAETSTEQDAENQLEPHIQRTHQRQAERQAQKLSEKRAREQVQEEHEVTFTKQQRVPRVVWNIVLIICLIVFIIALICFYTAPSARQVHVETHILVQDEVYIEAFRNISSAQYQLLTHNTILSMRQALGDINYERIEMNFKHRESPIRSDPLGVELVIDIYSTIYATPVKFHERKRELVEEIRDTLPNTLGSTFVGNLVILELWIAIDNPPTAELVCPDVTINTDPGEPTKTILLPFNDEPEVPEINGETPRVRRIYLSKSDPISRFPVGVTPVMYRVIYTNLQNGGAMAQCTFDITVKDVESPTIRCPLPDELILKGPDVIEWNLIVRDNVSDQSDITLKSTHSSGDSFPVGEDTLVVHYATDEAGNTATCSFIARP